MSADFTCATCGKDLLFELPRNISQWDSPTDKRVFCSGECIANSTPPSDCKIYRPDFENPPERLKFDL